MKVVYLFLGVALGFSHVAELFWLKDHFDVFDIQIITIAVHAIWGARFILGAFLDLVYQHCIQSFRVHVISAFFLLCIAWSIMVFADLDKVSFVAMLVLVEVLIAYVKTTLDFAVARTRDDEIVRDTIAYTIAGKILSRATGAGFSDLYGYTTVFAMNLCLYVFMFVCVSLVDESKYTPYALIKETSEIVEHTSMLKMLMVVVVALALVPDTEKSTDLFYIHVFGYSERDFMIPVLIGDLSTMIGTSRFVHPYIVVLILVSSYSIVYTLRVLVSTRLFPEFDYIALVAQFAVTGIVSGVFMTSFLTHLMHAPKNTKMEALRLSLFESIHVLSIGIGYGLSLWLLDYFDISQDNFQSISWMMLICSVPVGVITIVVTCLMYFFQSYKT